MAINDLFLKDYSKYDSESRNQLWLADIRSAILELDKKQEILVKSVSDVSFIVQNVKTAQNGLKIELNGIVDRVGKLETPNNWFKNLFKK